MADFLTYLFDCASKFIQDTHANGRDLWNSVQGEVHFVLSHPNGWEGFQQTQMREAIVKANLIPDNDKGHARVSFVTEGEANLHFSIENGLPSKAMDVRIYLLPKLSCIVNHRVEGRGYCHRRCRRRNS
jgi:hypothetical protein